MSIKNLYSNIRPSLDLNFAGSKTVDPRITFTRASTATYYDGKTVAKAEENLLIRSQEFDQTPWVTAGSTITGNVGIAPDETTTADRYLVTAGVSAGVRQIFSLVVGSTYTMSIWVKSNTGINQTFRMLGGAAFSADLTATTSWQRFTHTFSATSNSSHYLIISVASLAANDLLIWGAQLEQRDQATVYTPTTNQPITRYQPVLLTAPANTPRIDHDPITGECKGLLIEESRANLFPISEFKNGLSGLTRSGVLLSSLFGPDGGFVNAVRYDGGSAYAAISAGLTAGVIYTLSVYVKMHDGLPPNVSTVNTTWSENDFALVIGNARVDGPYVVQNCGNGLYRVSATGASGTNTANSGVWKYASNSARGFTTTGWQIELGAFPTSYIKTEASQVTRAEEKAYLPISSWYSFGGEGSFLYNFVQGLPISSQDNNAMYFGLFGSSALINGDDRGFSLYANNRYLSRNPSSVDPTLTGSVGLTKVALAMDSLGKYATKNGESVVSLAGSNLNNVLSPTHFSLSGSTNSRHHHHIKRIAYYPKRLSNQQLQALTL